MANAYRHNPSLACPLALKAACSKARLLARNAFTRPVQAAAVVARPVAAGERFHAGIGRFIGPVARQAFLSQLG